ncbi:MAG: tetratricopeptide repeat protein, partial [Pyrinomonadaceae bacterium]|nr:tetratricopeptide repeat protein [Pyrinomonadaceae bacterium]
REFILLKDKMRAATMTGQWQQLENLGTEAIRLCPSSSDGYHGLGLSYLRRGGTFAAVRHFRQALLRGDTPNIHLRLAEAYFVLNQHKFFAEEIAAAKAVNPDDPEPYYVAGRFLFQAKNELNSAAEEFRQALARDPEHFKARCYLGLSLKNMQHDTEAEQQFLKAIQLIDAKRVSFYLPYQALASFYLERNRVAEARPLIQRAVEMQSDVAANQFLLGKIAWMQKDEEVAVRALRTAISLDEAFIEARYLLAKIHQTRGDRDAARQELKNFEVSKELYGKGRLQ